MFTGCFTAGSTRGTLLQPELGLMACTELFIPFHGKQGSSYPLSENQPPLRCLPISSKCKFVFTGLFYTLCSCLEMKLVKVIDSKNGGSQLVRKTLRSCIIFLLPLHSLFPVVKKPSDSPRLLIKLKI